MAIVTISFEDAFDDEVELSIAFDPPLPEDPADATEAQATALMLYVQLAQGAGEDPYADLDMPDDEDEIKEANELLSGLFNDGESEEASREV